MLHQKCQTLHLRKQPNLLPAPVPVAVNPRMVVLPACAK